MRHACGGRLTEIAAILHPKNALVWGLVARCSKLAIISQCIRQPTPSPILGAFRRMGAPASRRLARSGRSGIRRKAKDAAPRTDAHPAQVALWSFFVALYGLQYAPKPLRVSFL